MSLRQDTTKEHDRLFCRIPIAERVARWNAVFAGFGLGRFSVAAEDSSSTSSVEVAWSLHQR